MKRVIVSIISAQSIPNLLFIREVYKDGDTLMYITSKKMESNIKNINAALHMPDVEQETVLLNEGEEENWEAMKTAISNKLKYDVKYLVNLTGGTKYMALAVQNVFEDYDAEFYYIPFPKNIILNQHQSSPIATRVNVEDYMLAHGHNIKCGDLLLDEQYACKMYGHFINDFDESDFNIINALRNYRKKNILVKDVEAGTVKGTNSSQIIGLQSFLEKIEFPYSDGRLTKYQVKYLTGGWFEEYVYYLVKREINPTDMKFGVMLQSTENDLDVVFTAGNKLFVVECKTGVEKKSMLNEIAYKAAALKDFMKGLSAESYIFSLGEGGEDWDSVAKAMGIKYLDRKILTNVEKLNNVFSEIKKKSN